MTIPRSLALFTLAYGSNMLANLALGIVVSDNIRLAMPEMVALLGDSFVPVYLALRFAVAAWLGWMIVFRASKVAKWFFIVIVAASLITVAVAGAGLQISALDSALQLVSMVFSVMAVGCLLLPESRFWFATKGRTKKADAAVFE